MPSLGLKLINHTRCHKDISPLCKHQHFPMTKHFSPDAPSSLFGDNIDHIHVRNFAPEPTVPNKADWTVAAQGDDVFATENAAIDPRRIDVRIVLDKPRFVRAVSCRYVWVRHTAFILTDSLFGNVDANRALFASANITTDEAVASCLTSSRKGLNVLRNSRF